MSPERTNATGRTNRPTRRRPPPTSSSTPASPRSDRICRLSNIATVRKAEKLGRAVLQEEVAGDDAQGGQRARSPNLEGIGAVRHDALFPQVEGLWALS